MKSRTQGITHRQSAHLGHSIAPASSQFLLFLCWASCRPAPGTRQAGRRSVLLGSLARWGPCGARPARVDGSQDSIPSPPSALGPAGSLRTVSIAAPQKAPPYSALASGSCPLQLWPWCSVLPSLLDSSRSLLPAASLPLTAPRYRHHLRARLRSCSLACQGPSP